ncbi:MAG TPA: beta-L-arabinofuranosidase domain-containing protein [Bauldia sp.]|nr:beta-L-arabinofuranosidase domain-containing protein [Bauldia sp.]
MTGLKPVDFTRVSMDGAFWRERLDTVLRATIPSQHARLEEHGILESLKLPKPVPPLRIPVGSHGMSTQVFWDSDVGKWIEAASYALRHRRDADIEAKIDAIVDDLEKAQAPDGYLNCWYLGREPDKRWTNLRDRHELYCAGHMLEGAIAYYQATGRRKFLDIMLRYIDHIATVFGPGPDQKRGYCGHQEIELALVKLYRLLGERKHLDLALYFINERGRQPHYFDIEAVARGDDPKKYWFKTYEYSQSHKPVREQDKAVGHAVRAMYMYTAMADLAAETGDAGLKRACEVLWKDVTSKRMYVTGGLGPSASNEGFTEDYDLENDTAYAETCASVALIFWAQRMLNLDCDGKYADVMELALFNGALSGLSRDGTHYFYENRLESNGADTRWAWHHCPCCTMNVSRLVASVGGYFYSTGEDTIAVHLYGGSTARLDVGARPVTIRQEAHYPWSGKIRLTVEPEAPTTFALKLRIPGWATGETLRLNGETIDSARRINGYVEIRREWKAGDAVELDLPMPARRIYAHPDVRADVGRVAIKRGPLVYCAEQADNGNRPVKRLRLPRGARLETAARTDLFDGIITVVADAEVAETGDWDGALYRTEPPKTGDAKLTAIPYYLWCNRGPGQMLVWIPEG